MPYGSSLRIINGSGQDIAIKTIAASKENELYLTRNGNGNVDFSGIESGTQMKIESNIGAKPMSGEFVYDASEGAATLTIQPNGYYVWFRS